MTLILFIILTVVSLLLTPGEVDTRAKRSVTRTEVDPDEFLTEFLAEHEQRYDTDDIDASSRSLKKPSPKLPIHLSKILE